MTIGPVSIAIGRAGAIGLLIVLTLGTSLLLRHGDDALDSTLTAGASAGAAETAAPAPAIVPASAETKADAATVEPPAFIGVVLPSEAVDVTTRVDGQITELRFGSASRVRRGDALAVLDTARLAESDLRIAEVELTGAFADAKRLQLELELAGARLARSESLAGQQLVSAQDLEEARYQQKLAEVRRGSGDDAIEQKRAVVEQRRTLLANAHVTAPFDGVVSIRYVDRGTTVARGAPIARIVRTDPLRLRFAASGEQAAKLQPGMRVAAHVPDMNVTLQGTILSVAPEIDAASQMLFVEATLVDDAPHAGPQPPLAGRTVRVTIATVRR